VPTPPVGTPLTLGTVYNGNIATTTQTDNYTFTLTSTTTVQFDSTNIVDPYLYVSLTGPTGPVYTQSIFNDHSYGLQTLVPGTYTLSVSGNGSYTGTYSIRLFDVATATPETIPASGLVVSGTLDAASATDAYKFTATAGSQYYFNAQSGAGSLNWALYDAYGNQVFYSGFYDAGTVTLPRTGTYTLLVDGNWNATGTQAYSFGVYPVVPTVTPLTLGTVYNGNIATPGAIDTYTFTLASTTTVAFDSTNVVDTSLLVSLTGPAGSVYSNRPLYYDYGYGPQTLAPGTYTLSVAANGTYTGTYSIRLFDVATATPETIPASGLVVSGTLNPASAIDAYKFSGTAGSQYYFNAQAGAGSLPRWGLFDAYGNQIFNAGFYDQGTVTLPRTGTYTLLLYGQYNATGTQAYTFGIYPTTPTVTPLTLGTVYNGNIATPGASDTYTFTLASPAKLYFDALADPNQNLYVSVTGPAGTVINNQNLQYDQYYTYINPLVLPAGSYTLTINGAGSSNTGTYSFRLFDLATATPETIPSTGLVVSDTLDPAAATNAYKFTATAGSQYYFNEQSASQGNVTWRLLGPYGNAVFDAGFSDQATVTLPNTGTYTLLVEGYLFTATTTTYSFGVYPVVPATTPLTLGNPVSGQIATPGAVNQYTFTLAGAAQLYFDGLSADSGIVWSLTGPAGTTVNNAYFGYDVYTGSSPYYNPLNLVAGSYTLSVYGSGASTGNYQFRLFDLATGTPVIPGDPVTDTLNPASSTNPYQLALSVNTAMVGDINPGSASSNPTDLVNVNGTLYFVANDGTNGAQLWTTDGSPGGTRIVKLINPAGANPANLVNVNGTLYFTANDGTDGVQIWKSTDGTAANTTMVANLGAAANPGDLVAYQNKLAFTATTTAAGTQLWITDGTSAGTVMVSDVNPGASAGLQPENLTASGVALVFSGNDGVTGRELWHYGNSAPVFTTIPDQTVDVLHTLNVTASATNADPTLTNTYSLTGTIPSGVAINSSTGQITWTPTVAQGPGTYTITVVATNNGIPPLASQTTFQVVVRGAPTVAVGSSASPSTYGQTVTFTVNVGSVTAGQPTPTGTVQFEIDGGDFGNPVTLDNSGAATSGAIATLSAAHHTITAVYSGDPTFAAGFTGNFTQVVNVAHLTVTADAKSKLYGAANPALTYTVTGFVNGDTSAVVSGTPALSTTATAASPVGAYPITIGVGTLSATNYDFPTLVNGTLTINKAHLTVTADAKSMLYGGTVPGLTATITGFVNGENATTANVTGTPNLSTTATSTSPVGPYLITVVNAGTLSATNYDFPTLVNGTLTIGKAHLTVTADNKDMNHYDAVPTLTDTITGFVNGQTASVVSGAPSLATTATSTSVAGYYPITIGPGTLSATNYDFPTLVPGQLTVHPKVMDVRVDYGSKSMSLIGLTRDLPFINITALEVIFSDPVSVSQSMLSLTGVNVPSYGTSFSYNAAKNDATWTLPTAVGVDRLLLALNGVTAPPFVGIGPNISVDPFSKAFAVLPGDVNGDGVVNASDLIAVRNQMPQYLPVGVLPQVWADVDGSGTIDTADVTAVGIRAGKKLP
jgi:ELWxxDGT repeat protein